MVMKRVFIHSLNFIDKVLLTIVFECPTVRDCGTPNSTVNGNFSLSGTVVNSTATYSCHNGFSLEGNATIVCKPDGTWSKEIALCLRK